MLGNKLHNSSFGKMLERAVFDAQLTGEKENGAITRTKTFEKFNGRESKDTAKIYIVNWI
jgi:hypothetical protein